MGCFRLTTQGKDWVDLPSYLRLDRQHKEARRAAEAERDAALEALTEIARATPDTDSVLGLAAFARIALKGKASGAGLKAENERLKAEMKAIGALTDEVLHTSNPAKWEAALERIDWRVEQALRGEEAADDGR